MNSASQHCRPVIYKALSLAQAASRGCGGSVNGAVVADLRAVVEAELAGCAAVAKVDYISFADPNTGEELDGTAVVVGGTVLSTAVVMVGEESDPVRLLDNVVL
jgi:pantothenate synthetase